MKELNLPKQSVYVRYSDGVYHSAIQDRFDKSISSTPIYNFLSYAKAIPNPSDLFFLGLLDNNFTTDDYYQKKVRETIDEIKTNLGK